MLRSVLITLVAVAGLALVVWLLFTVRATFHSAL
ncbi:hypothetical protein J2S66_001913 [Saccharothrix longispora]|uniref:Uncharacterized protein n=1 Tax=Saccharothrix longispora TaxID=33920 RepID=A0ABU1PTT0_9PSEU|nr:hypothetical protein [Saccharothrix longispora]